MYAVSKRKNIDFNIFCSKASSIKLTAFFSQLILTLNCYSAMVSSRRHLTSLVPK